MEKDSETKVVPLKGVDAAPPQDLSRGRSPGTKSQASSTHSKSSRSRSRHRRRHRKDRDAKETADTDNSASGRIGRSPGTVETSSMHSTSSHSHSSHRRKLRGEEDKKHTTRKMEELTTIFLGSSKDHNVPPPPSLSRGRSELSQASSIHSIPSPSLSSHRKTPKDEDKEISKGETNDISMVPLNDSEVLPPKGLSQDRPSGKSKTSSTHSRSTHSRSTHSRSTRSRSSNGDDKTVSAGSHDHSSRSKRSTSRHGRDAKGADGKEKRRHRGTTPGVVSSSDDDEFDRTDRDDRSERKERRRHRAATAGAVSSSDDDDFDRKEKRHRRGPGEHSGSSRHERSDRKERRRQRAEAPGAVSTKDDRSRRKTPRSKNESSHKDKAIRKAARYDRGRKQNSHSAQELWLASGDAESNPVSEPKTEGDSLIEAEVVDVNDTQTENSGHAATRENGERDEEEQREEIIKEVQNQYRRRAMVLAIVVLLVAGGISAFFAMKGPSDTESDVVVDGNGDNITMVITPSPSLARSSSPTNVPSLSPTEQLKYAPPNPEECSKITNGETLDGEEDLELLKFGVLLDVELVNGTDVATALPPLLTNLEKILMPQLAGCAGTVVERRLRGSPRRLANIRNVIANGEMDLKLMDGIACETSTSNFCYVAKLNLDLRLLGPERKFEILVLLSEIFGSYDNELVPILNLEEPFRTVSVTQIGPREDTASPSQSPTNVPSFVPSDNPSESPSPPPTSSPSNRPTGVPSVSPSASPTCIEMTSFFGSGLFQEQDGGVGATYTIDCTAQTDLVILTRDSDSCSVNCVAALPYAAFEGVCATERSVSVSLAGDYSGVPLSIGQIDPGSSFACESTLKLETSAPTPSPTIAPTKIPTMAPTKAPTKKPTKGPTSLPSASPSEIPSLTPTRLPSSRPSRSPSASPTEPVPTPFSQTLTTTYRVDGETLIFDFSNLPDACANTDVTVESRFYGDANSQASEDESVHFLIYSSIGLSTQLFQLRDSEQCVASKPAEGEADIPSDAFNGYIVGGNLRVGLTTTTFIDVALCENEPNMNYGEVVLSYLSC
mmetsp:Transcript_43570/g.105139  ORF Transcript_43570/g.105139 Transcript_43570/m.105139 type:complete len:1063 (-) Transcript_43570:116-3304(-)